MLEKFRLAKEAEINALKKLQDQGHTHQPWILPRPPLRPALVHPKSHGIIAEFKRASPSQGDINVDISPLDACLGYARAGASALSILTESRYFKGELNFLVEVAQLGLPLLRKDFIIHPLQVLATRATPASAILLIVRMFPNQKELDQIHGLCLDLDLEPVVEIFDHHDLDRAKEIGARIIQVNHRDLDTLQTDLNRSLELVQHKEAGEIWIGASGISTLAQVQTLKRAGLDALLLGTALMHSHDPGQSLAKLINPKEDHHDH